MGWNTTSETIWNYTPWTLYGADLEDIRPGGFTAEIAGDGHNGTFVGGALRGKLIFPWCSNSWEIYTKALIFMVVPIGAAVDRSQVLFYVFQNYLDSQIYWYPSTAGQQPVWSDIIWCGEGPCSFANMNIGLAPGAPGGDPSGKDFTVQVSATHS